MKNHHVPRDGVRDMPSIPADMYKYKSPPLGKGIAEVPDKTSASQTRGKA